MQCQDVETGPEGLVGWWGVRAWACWAWHFTDAVSGV